MKLEPETVFQYGDQWFRIAEFEPVENAELIIKANRASAPGHGGEGAGVSEARVKPLEWVRSDDRRWIGNAALPPNYQVRDATWWRVGESLRFHCDTPDEAKAAAQADFDKRIRSALTATQSAPAPGGWREALELFASHLRGMSHVVQDGYVVHITKDDYERIVAPLSAFPAPEPVADAVVEATGGSTTAYTRDQLAKLAFAVFYSSNLCAPENIAAVTKEIDCDGDCEHVRGSHCNKEERGEFCPFSLAEDLRQISAALYGPRDPSHYVASVFGPDAMPALAQPAPAAQEAPSGRQGIDPLALHAAIETWPKPWVEYKLGKAISDAISAYLAALAEPQPQEEGWQ